MFEKCSKKLKNKKKGQQWSNTDKKPVDKDAICPINGQTSVLYPYWLTFLYFLTNLGPISLSILFFTPPMLQISDFGG